MPLSRRHFLQHCTAAALIGGSKRLRAEQHQSVLRIGTFYGYDNSTVVEKFQQETGIKIEFVGYENTEEITAELVRNEKKLDIAICSDFMLPHLATLGLIQPLQEQWLPNLKRQALDRRFAASATIANSWFAWPNDWGTTGILYYRSKVKFEPKNWRDFFALINEHKKKVSVPDDQTTVVGTVLKSLGYSLNDTNPQHLLAAAAVLKAIRPQIRTIDSDTDLTMQRDILAMGWSDTAYALAIENPDLVYVLPPEGGELWSDWYFISSRCQDVRAAHEFLNYLFTPANVVENVILNGHSPVDSRVLPLLPEDIRNNKILFPSDLTLSKMELANQASLREPLRGEIFAQFKHNKWSS